jgi:hypothetical protein
MPQAGEVLFYRDYEYPDGGKPTNKLFVIINNTADTATPFLVLKTTSQSRRYQGVRKGCNPDKKVFFLEGGAKELFDGNTLHEPTYVQLPLIIEFSQTSILQARLKDRVSILTGVRLSPLCIAQLKNCLKKFKQDISAKNIELIFK